MHLKSVAASAALALALCSPLPTQAQPINDYHHQGAATLADFLGYRMGFWDAIFIRCSLTAFRDLDDGIYYRIFFDGPEGRNPEFNELIGESLKVMRGTYRSAFLETAQDLGKCPDFMK